MKSIHKINRKGKRAVHKKRKHGRWSNTFVQTTDLLFNPKIASPLAREPQQKCCGFFLFPQSRKNPGIWDPPDLPLFWFLLKVAEVRKLPLQLPLPRVAAGSRSGTAASVKVAKDRRPFANKSTFLIRNSPPTQPFYYIRKSGIVKDFILFFCFIRVDLWE